MRDEENKNRPDYAARPNAFRSPPEHHPLTLTHEDAAAIDAILENGGGSKQYAQQEMDERGVRAGQWLETLGTHRVNQPPMDLAQRTMAAVSDERMKFEPAAAEKSEQAASARSGLFSRRFAEFAAMAIAATVLLVVLIPGIGQARQTAMRAECASNQGALGRAFASYAATHTNALPSLAMGTSWQPVDPAAASPVNHSNTANILPLVREKFINSTEVARLTCPAAAPTTPVNWSAEMNDLPEAMRGYNLVNMYGPQKPTWDKNANTIILADANPIFKAGCKSISENSPNHAGKGSMVLYADGSARWQQSADIGPNHDNIWTVADKPNLEGYTYREAPQSLMDVFLSP